MRALPDDAIGLDVKPSAKLRADIRSSEAMRFAQDELGGRDITACVHLAAIASPPLAAKNPDTAWAANVQGTYNVLELCRLIGCKRFVFISSAHVYGISPRYLPTDENHPTVLHDLYTTTKLLGEQLCRMFYEHHGMSYAALRLFNAYGPGQSKDYFIGAKLAQARAGSVTLRNGGVSKDWVHVGDVCRAIMRATESTYVGPINIGTGHETRLVDIVDEIAAASGLSVIIEDVTMEGPTRMCADWRRAASVLDWEPRIKFSDGLAELIETSKMAAA
jgi:UDP-glucose 4-epimerase